MIMVNADRLETYWITFPRDQFLPLGIGVTAYSEEDAFALIVEQGFDQWYEGASEIKVTPGVRLEDLDLKHVAVNLGPLQFRGVWYPAANIGFGSPRGGTYRSF